MGEFGVKNIMKRGLALLLTLILIVGFIPADVIAASTATVEYRYDGNYIYNWGKRGEVATFLSPKAEEFYENTSYSELAALSGSATESAIPSSALYKRLRSIMAGAQSYVTSYDATKSLFKYTDCQGSGKTNSKISSFYSGTGIGPSWDGGWNREHTWPNSKGDKAGSGENDLMMLRPTASSENSSRGNAAFGLGGSYYDPNSESNGAYNLRGDVARIILFVYVRWECTNTGSDYNPNGIFGTKGVFESKDRLLAWMEEDPVDTWELGRNDSVQSITGTRNVFVDYPELAFDLFEAEIPVGYQSPSGMGAASAHTITAVSNNENYGTVSLAGKTITAYPKTGYQVSGYQVLSGTATVTRNGNVFTVTASSDCKIEIQFTPRTQATVTFVERGVTQSTKTAYTGDSITLPACTAAVPEGYAFRGWVTQRIPQQESKPAVYGANSGYNVTGDITFYALYAKLGEGETEDAAYVLVSDASQLKEGASVVITAATSAIAMKQTGGSNNRYAGTIAKNEDSTITFTEDALIDVLTLGKGANTGTYSFFSVANSQYLAAGTTSGSNILKLQTSVDAAASFTITVNSDGTATVVSKTSSDRNLLCYNSSANVFACYNSGQIAISLYVLSGEGDQYYTTDPVTCAHENTVSKATVAATCTQSGFTAGVFCQDCQMYISGHEVVEALGHDMDAGVVTTPATCTEAGVKTYTCGRCGEKETETVKAAGHSYDDGVVTPPTETEQGYTIYTCTVCGHSYQDHFTDATGLVYKVSFKVPYGVTPVADMSCNKFGITLPEAGKPVGDYDYTFAGWVTAVQEDSEQQPELLEAGETYYATQNITLYALYTYTVGGTGNAEYTLTDIADIKATDTVVITMTCQDGTVYALDNDNGTSSAPTGIVINTADGKLTSDPTANIKWNIGGSAGAYIFYPEGSTTTWLYCTSTNNGVRVGTDANNKFSIYNNSYLKHTGTSRYVGVYKDKPDWRCYTSTSVNIGNQTLGFYVKGEVGTTYYTTVITNSCTHDSYENGFCVDCGLPKPVVVEQWNVSLTDHLNANFHLNIDPEDQVKITVGDEVLMLSASELAVTETGKYVATVSVAATQMMDAITVQVVGEEDDAPATYTIRQYADTILADQTKGEYHALVKEMLNYGGKAQQYFAHNTENLANAGINDVEAENVPENTTELSVAGTVEGIRFYAASLVYRDKVALRFYFKTTAELIGSYTFTVNGAEAEPAYKADGELYYIEVAGITPDKLDQQIRVVVTGADENTLAVSYSPMNYIVRMSAKGSESLKALLKALYNYHLAAKLLCGENSATNKALDSGVWYMFYTTRTNGDGADMIDLIVIDFSLGVLDICYDPAHVPADSAQQWIDGFGSLEKINGEYYFSGSGTGFCDFEYSIKDNVISLFTNEFSTSTEMKFERTADNCLTLISDCEFDTFVGSVGDVFYWSEPDWRVDSI